MTILEINIGYISEDDSERTSASIPVEVLDVDGALIAGAGVTAKQDQYVQLPFGTEGPVFVRARLPSGERQTKRVEIKGQTRIPVMLFDRYVSPNEWLAWSRPLIRVEDLPINPVSLDQFGNLWTRLWRRINGKWEKEPNIPQNTELEDYAGQLELELEHSGYLLQIGGDLLPWRFVALPGGGRVRVLIATNVSHDPRIGPLRVVVSRMKPDEEILLAYLMDDRLKEAQILSEAPRLAEQLLYGKYDDPVSACIGAYFLLRIDRLNRRLQWAENLYRDMDWLADGAVILASQLLREKNPPLDRIDSLLDEALERGVPIYLEGMRLLDEACQILASQPSNKQKAESRRRRVENYLAAANWSGPMSSYFGRLPDQPSTERSIGLPGSRKKTKQYVERMINLIPQEIKAAFVGPPALQSSEFAFEKLLFALKSPSFLEFHALPAFKPTQESNDPSVYFIVKNE